MANNFPLCPNLPVACPGTDVVTINTSSETPDAIRYFGFKFFGDQWGLCIASSPELAALCDLPFPSNPPPVILASSTPQTCEVPCDGLPVSYTVVAGSFVAADQADADALAFQLACEIAQILCDGGSFTLFVNTQQTCSVTCADGTVSNVIMPAGVATGLSQASANSFAQALACVVAEVLCNQEPTSLGIPPFGGAGSTVPAFYFGNTQQSCDIPCPDGQSIYTRVVAQGSFLGSSPAAANAVAESYACNQSLFRPACLSSVVTDMCFQQPYADLIFVSEFTAPEWDIVSGVLPIGIFFSDGFFSGSPVETGDFSVRVRATQGSDYVERTYTFTVREITTFSPLPVGTVGTPYSEVLTQTGFGSGVTWAVTQGALPSGLALNAFTGAITGTPTLEASTSFVITATEGSASCEKTFDLDVISAEIAPAAWYTCESAGASLIDAANGNNMALFAGPGAFTSPGKVNLGATWATQLASALYQSGQLAGLANTAEDINIFGWSFFDVDSGKTQTISFDNDLGDLMTLSFVTPGNFTVNFGALAGARPAAGSFFFWRLHWDSATQKLGMGFNGAAPTYEAGNTVFSPAATAQLQITFSNNFTGAEEQKLDECCLFIGMMQQAQIDDIYNAGAGRTYP